ncbi:MAG: SDR family oxidoreductase [Acidobacteria bacterium]|nr:SDR family oxidoreductase [Acidobacteriota bacterium]
MFRLDSKVAVVTGAASGIGAAIAATFAAAGALVYVTDHDRAGAQARAGEIAAAGGTASALSLEVTSEPECAAAAARVLADSGRCDILVNNAGIGGVGTILETSGEDMDRMYAVNVRGVFNVTKAFLPAMVHRGAGSVINLASVGGVVGIRERVAYCTTKAAVVGMTRSLALDHAGRRVRFNCICPGRVETPFLQARIREYADPDAAYREMAATQLFERMIRPEEVAAAALYLASDAAEMVTGTTFMIDSGWSAGK